MPDPPDGSLQELVKGIIITMPPAGALHGFCCSKIGNHLSNFDEQNKLGNVFCNNTGFVVERNPDTVFGPDVSFWSNARLPELPDGYPDVPPDLAIEVVSPSDHFGRLRRKIEQYLECGGRLVGQRHFPSFNDGSPVLKTV